MNFLLRIPSSHLLSATKQVASHAILQLIVLLTSVLRIPLVGTNFGLDLFVGYLFWGGLLAATQILVSGFVNTSRIAYLSATQAKRYVPIPAPIMMAIVSVTSLLVFLVSLSGFGYWLTGAIFMVLTLAVSRRLASFLGIAQAMGLQPKINLLNGVSNAASLGLTFFVALAAKQAGTPTNISFLLLMGIASLSLCSPYLFSWFLVRKTPYLMNSSEGKNSKETPAHSLFELFATFPPVLISGLDLVFLSILSSQNELLQYAIYSRTSILVSFIPAALYIPVSNILNRGRIARDFRSGTIALFLIMVNVPFVLLFVFFAPTFVTYLSGGFAATNYSLVLSYSLLSFMQISWIVTSGVSSRSSPKRVALGKAIFLYVSPITVLSTSLGAFFLGATGVVLASSLSYLSAIYCSLRANLRKEQF
jgi:hypothetical protein